ncbi:unnamed protein product [Soboliphyme baturini]|uniref:G_PROTEIN_RECEP_F1_2 domain-containing protein n=1 Tax=Soboliphyme baturini TaxID=241478 RepID=A0A183IKB5_9BILA|nr:unnamed protein product [Soboliphyme baturini]
MSNTLDLTYLEKLGMSNTGITLAKFQKFCQQFQSSINRETYTARKGEENPWDKIPGADDRSFYFTSFKRRNDDHLVGILQASEEHPGAGRDVQVCQVQALTNNGRQNLEKTLRGGQHCQKKERERSAAAQALTISLFSPRLRRAQTTDGRMAAYCGNDTVNLSVYELREEQLEVLKEITAVITGLGLFTIVTSSVAVLVIVKSPELHTQSFFLIGFCSMNDFVSGLAYFTFGLHRLLQPYEVEGLLQSQCCRRASVMFYSQTFTVFLAILLAVDRAVAIFRPVFYRSVRFSKFYLPMVIVFWLVSVIETVLMIIVSLNDNRLVKFCESNECWGSTTAVFVYQGTTVFLVVIVVLFSIAIIGLTHARNAVFRESHHLPQRAKRVKMHLTVIRTEAVILIIITLSQICGRVCVLVAYSVSDRFLKTIFISAFRILIATTAASNFFTYVVRSSKFRASFWKMLLRRNATNNQCC